MLNEISLLDSLLDDVMSVACSQSYGNTPSVDVVENKDKYILQMDLPGRTDENVNIELDKNLLTISSKESEKSGETSKKEKNEETFLIRERNLQNFKRSFSLPDDVDCEKIEASFKNGVLTISMAKKEIAAPKKILIQAA